MDCDVVYTVLFLNVPVPDRPRDFNAMEDTCACERVEPVPNIQLFAFWQKMKERATADVARLKLSLVWSGQARGRWITKHEAVYVWKTLGANENSHKQKSLDKSTWPKKYIVCMYFVIG